MQQTSEKDRSQKRNVKRKFRQRRKTSEMIPAPYCRQSIEDVDPEKT